MGNNDAKYLPPVALINDNHQMCFLKIMSSAAGYILGEFHFSRFYIMSNFSLPAPKKFPNIISTKAQLTVNRKIPQKNLESLTVKVP